MTTVISEKLEIRTRRAHKRGCGWRKPGGIYLVSDTIGGGRGKPAEHFFLDPLRTPAELELGRVNPRGQQVVVQGNVALFVDWIGAEHYPTPIHFMDECARYGLSRRTSWNTIRDPAVRQAKEWYLLAVHPRGYPQSWRELVASWPGEFGCPRSWCGCQHCRDCAHPSGPCPRLLWADEKLDDGRAILRRHPVRPAGVKVEWAVGAFALFWIPRVEVVIGAGGEGLKRAHEVANVLEGREVWAVQDVVEETGKDEAA